MPEAPVVRCLVALLALAGVGCGNPSKSSAPPPSADAGPPELAPDPEETESVTGSGSTPAHPSEEAALPPLAYVTVDVDGDVNPDDRPHDRDWLPASLQVTLAGEDPHTGRAGIHVRGNSSADFDKKSYALETWTDDDADVDVALLGLPAEADWVLHGPHSDKTLIRNHLIYTLSRDIGRYAARTRFAELELNGEYRGVYVLMEKIKRDSVRVDLPDGAALLKRDWVEGGDRFIRTDLCRDTVKVEWPADTTGVLDRLDAVEAELLDGNHDRIDLDAFVDHMLLVELGRNVDGYVLSTWITLSADDVLGMGAIWDYNGALGNAGYFEAWEPEGWHYDNPEFPADNPNGFCWYEALLDDPRFLERRRDRWRAHRAGPWSDAAIAARIDEAVAVVQPAVDRNFERWPVLGRYVWPNDPDAPDRETYAEEVAYLQDWMQDRAAWLDGEL